MGSNERKERGKEELKRKILDAATEIIVKEGYENLSIRKIAQTIEYSPGNIYHYFKNKAEIISFIVDEGYKKILQSQSRMKIDLINPEKSLVESLKDYINLQMDQPNSFRAILLNDIEGTGEKIGVLEEGISKKRKTFEVMIQVLDLCVQKGIFRPVPLELTAQIIWCATHGLITRLILEKNIPDGQKENLINRHFDVLLKGLMNQE